MPLNQKHTMRFGKDALVLASAAQPDYSILSRYAMQVDDKHIQQILLFCRYRLGAVIHAVHVANICVSMQIDMDGIDYLALDAAAVQMRVPTTKIFGLPVQCALSLENADALYQDIIQVLSDNREIVK